LVEAGGEIIFAAGFTRQPHKYCYKSSLSIIIAESKEIGMLLLQLSCGRLSAWLSKIKPAISGDPKFSILRKSREKIHRNCYLKPSRHDLRILKE